MLDVQTAISKDASTPIWVLPFTGLVRMYYNRHLIWQFLKRDIAQRYRGAFFGIGWSFITPLLMLSVYVFVFGFVFKSRFGVSEQETTVDYGLALFCGLNLFNLFSELVLRSPSLILQNPNYVKKVVFPLEILSVMATGTAVFHCLVAFIPLAIGLGLTRGTLPVTILYLPLFVAPLALAVCGLSWVLAAIGVFIRDIQQALSPGVLILMFLSAIFYPIQAVPEQARHLLALNPMITLIDNARKAIVWGIRPDYVALAYLAAGSILLFLLGYIVFIRSRSAFADVI
jgi:lipopolysaccharide transport system permease protein